MLESGQNWVFGVPEIAVKEVDPVRVENILQKALSHPIKTVHKQAIHTSHFQCGRKGLAQCLPGLEPQDGTSPGQWGSNCPGEDHQRPAQVESAAITPWVSWVRIWLVCSRTKHEPPDGHKKLCRDKECAHTPWPWGHISTIANKKRTLHSPALTFKQI